MKKTLLFCVTLIVLLLCSCEAGPTTTESGLNDTTLNSGEETLRDKFLLDIESEYKKESEKEEYTKTVGMIELAYKYADKWNAVSEEYYNKIVIFADEFFPDEKDAFVKELDILKLTYDKYVKSSMDVHTKVYNLKYSGGSIIGPLCATQYYELRKEYALELVGIYEDLTFDMK